MKNLKRALFAVPLLITLNGHAQLVGDLDSTFNLNGKVITNFNNGNDGGLGIVIQPDTKIIVAGYTVVGNNENFALVRYHDNGTNDLSFGTGGQVITDFAAGYDFASSLVLQSDGKIIAAGQKTTNFVGDNALIRYHPDGTLDSTFGINGKVFSSHGLGDAGINAVKLQADGKIVVCGISTTLNGGPDFQVTRYNSNGTIDNTFGTSGTTMIDFGGTRDFPFGLQIQADGKIVIGGAAGPDPQYNYALARLDSTGILDATYGTGGTVITTFGGMEEWCNAIALQGDGKILMTGYSTGNGNPYKVAVARFTDAGVLDTTFNSTGKVLTAVTNHDVGNAIALQTDGKIVMGGVAFNASNQDFSIYRLNTDGSLDSTFSTNGSTTTDFGSSDRVRALAIQADGKIVAAGISGQDFAVARYLVTSSVGINDFATFNNDVVIYPNPAGDRITINYSLNQFNNITIRLTDITGRLASTIVSNELQPAGQHQKVIDLSEISSGVYFLIIDNGTQSISRKLIR
jgi:uncharacterized delta-60 repeat protein